MARVTHKAVVEEQGQRTARSTDVYLPKEGHEPALCKKCGALYRDKRWTAAGKEPGTASLPKVVCPACQRMADNNPGGIVTFAGDYLIAHEETILNAIKNIEAKSRGKNPMGRIMEISQDKNVLTIATTEDKLAQKLGREIFKSHRGELHYRWSHGENFVRVSWFR